MLSDGMWNMIRLITWVHFLHENSQGFLVRRIWIYVCCIVFVCGLLSRKIKRSNETPAFSSASSRAVQAEHSPKKKTLMKNL